MTTRRNFLKATAVFPGVSLLPRLSTPERFSGVVFGEEGLAVVHEDEIRMMVDARTGDVVVRGELSAGVVV